MPPTDQTTETLYSDPTEVMRAMEGATVEKFDPPPSTGEADWRAEYEQLQRTTFVIDGVEHKLDTFKESAALLEVVEPYGDEDTSFLDAVAARMAKQFGGEFTWAQASRFYQIITDRSTRLKKTVETSPDSSGFII